MIDGTFALVPGVGPARERELFRKGSRRWEDLPPDGTVLSPKLDASLREAVARAQSLRQERRWTELAALLPVREHWRLLAELEHEATYLDIEAGADGRVSVIGVWDAAGGPRLYVRGDGLGAFVEERPRVLVTFNGGAYDLPMLRRTFPRWGWDGLHVDLLTVAKRMREPGGLKALEDRLGIGRPEHLKGLRGSDAVYLWSVFRTTRDRDALRRLLEYNLYDVVQLRALAQLACERLAAKTGREWSPRDPFRRGDVLLDVTRAVEAVVARVEAIVPDASDDEERVALRL